MKHKPNPKVHPPSNQAIKTASERIYRNRRSGNIPTAVKVPDDKGKGGIFKGRYV